MTGRKSDAASPTRRGAPSPWWRYLLAYPTLAVALLTAVPTWIDKIQALTHNVERGEYREAKLQQELYAKNLDCTTAPFDWFINPSNVNLDATICESGDIYVRANAPGGLASFYFVPVDRVLGKHDPAALSLIGAAKAADRPALVVAPAVVRGPVDTAGLLTRVQVRQQVAQTSVICTRFVDSRRVLRHLRTAQACFDEVVDTLNGRTVSRTQVACRRTC